MKRGKKMCRAKLFLLAVLMPLLLGRCDKGIEPLPDTSTVSGPTGFSGKVTFTGAWPQGIKRTHLVVFQNPIETSQDFLPPNFSFVADSIPYGSTQFVYNSVDNNFYPVFQLSPGSYRYVVVAQSKSPTLSLDRKDWTVVGVYYANGNTSSPGVLTIEQNRMTINIDINVDFNNLPPQPPGG